MSRWCIMFKATKPFNDKVTNYPQEPSLRIGRTVPKNAVNLAYYYNPTATDTEKVLTAEAPRQTIDHRVEEAYRYLFNQASDDDNLFPGYVWYEDEEGYQGRLGRMYVTWYPEAHIETKNHQMIMDQIVSKREDVLKMIEYPEDAYGYSGNLYLDACTYEVYSTRNESSTEKLKREVFNHELSYGVIHGRYISPFDLDKWLVPPSSTQSSMWPSYIEVGQSKLKCTCNQASVQNYVNRMTNPYDEATGVLVFDRIEYEPVFNTQSTSGTSAMAAKESLGAACKSGNYSYSGGLGEEDEGEGKAEEAEQFVKDKEAEVRRNIFGAVYMAEYNQKTDLYDYSEIQNFLSMASSRCVNTGAYGFSAINQAMRDNKDIVIFLDELHSVFDDVTRIDSNFHFEASYSFRIADRGTVGLSYYNVIAVYSAIGDNALTKYVTRIKEVPDKYIAHANYTGILRKVWYDYDGVAYYRGAVTKGNSVGNINPEDDNEILMFSDADGYLRRPVYRTVESGATVLKNFYRVEADSVYLTDVFKDGIACFYKYPLKKTIYDYRGPDAKGFYKGDAVKMYTSNLKELPDGYVYNIKLKATKTEEKEFIKADGYSSYKEVPVEYDAAVYTSFISCSTDTFRVTYNAYSHGDNNNASIESGVTEEIYNYPFMAEGIDYYLEEVDSRQRVNKIKLPKPYRLRDSRHYVTFTFTVNAARKGTCKIADDGTVQLLKASTVIKSDPITVSILNKDYALPCEYNKFDGRGYIISPIADGVYFSPMDIILKDQAARRDETVIKHSDTDYVFFCEIQEMHDIHLGAINIKCNPDGSGIITAETTIDTGFIDDIDAWEMDDENYESSINSVNYGLYKHTTKLTLDSPYWVEDGWIYPGVKVKCIDSRHIKVLPPREDGLLDSWYPRIQFGHYSQVMDQYGAHTKVCYSMPEYDKQYFSPLYGRPFVDVKSEKVEILNSHMVKLKCFPLKVGSITIYKQLGNDITPINIRDISFSDGILILSDAISENDNVLCDYTYLEETNVYRGYWRDIADFCRIDLNPNIYHTYNDPNYVPSEVKPTKNLFNKVIYFFMRPTLIYEVKEADDDLIYDKDTINITSDLTENDLGTIIQEEANTLYHQIDNPQPQSNRDIYIGSVFIRQNSSLHSTIVVDSRTRGGGILDSISDSLRKELEPESDFYLDIGYYDGEPYQENGVIIVRLDNSLLKEFGGRFTPAEVEEKVNRWLGFGIYPIIEYVDSYSKKDMPQYNLTVEDSYTNVMDITPEIHLECVGVS